VLQTGAGARVTAGLMHVGLARMDVGRYPPHPASYASCMHVDMRRAMSVLVHVRMRGLSSHTPRVAQVF